MPLPEAKPDKRIYELLKNVDLENLTFDDLQAVGQTIFAEQGAEDELRRLVLVNLARLSTVGEWTGLTSAGGSSGVIGAFPDLSSFTPTAGGEIILTSTVQPGQFLQRVNKTIANYGTTYYYYFGITVNTTKTYTTAGFMASSAAVGNQVTLAIYDAADDTLLPQNKLASTVVDLDTIGKCENTLTVEAGQSMALTKGDFVWLAFKFTAVVDNTRSVRCTDEIDNYCLGGNITGTDIFNFNSIVSTTAPSTFAASDFVSTFSIEAPILIWS